MNISYHYLIMSQKDLLQNQVIEEILREKSSYYATQNKIPDYWILISPNFIKDESFNSKIKKTRFFKNQSNKIVFNSKENKEIEFYASLVSLDKDFMNWIKLRLGYFEDLNNFEPESLLSSYVSDGVYGEYSLDKNVIDALPFLSSSSNLIHPDIILEKLSNSIKSFY